MDPGLTGQPGNRRVQNARARDRKGEPTDSCVFPALAGYVAALEKSEGAVKHAVDPETFRFRRRSLFASLPALPTDFGCVFQAKETPAGQEARRAICISPSLCDRMNSSGVKGMMSYARCRSQFRKLPWVPKSKSLPSTERRCYAFLPALKAAKNSGFGAKAPPRFEVNCRAIRLWKFGLSCLGLPMNVQRKFCVSLLA